MSLEPPPPQAIVIFGGSGDLSRRKVLPGLAAPPKEGVPPPVRSGPGACVRDGVWTRGPVQPIGMRLSYNDREGCQAWLLV